MNTIYTPLNGNEIKSIISKQFNQWVESLYLLKAYSAFHKASLKLNFEMTAYPSDVPVPKGELSFDLLPKLFEDVKDKFKKHINTIEELEVLKNEIDDILDLVNPFAKRYRELEAGDIPDKLRVEHGLPVLVMDNSRGKTREVEKIISK